LHEVVARGIARIVARHDLLKVRASPRRASADRMSIVLTLKAHIDGKVFVPDEPVDIRVDEPVTLRVERIEQTARESVRQAPALLGMFEGRIWIADDFNDTPENFRE